MSSLSIRIQPNSVFGLRTGPIVTINGSEHEIHLKRDYTSCVFRSIDTNCLIELSRDEFISGILAKTITFPASFVKPQEDSSGEPMPSIVRDPKHIPTAIWRHYFVAEQLKLPPSARTRKNRLAANKVAFDKARQDPNVPVKFLRKPKAPDLSNVYEWMHDWDPALGVISLVPDFFKCGRTPSRLHPIYEQIIEQGISKFVDTANQRRNGTLGEILDNVAEAFDTRPELKKFPQPDRSTIYRRIRALGGELITALEKGKRIAYRRFAPVLGSFRALKPLERVEIDTTRLDRIHTSYLRTDILPRAYLTVVVDVRTRMILAFDITMTAPNSTDIRRILRMAVQLKDPAYLKRMGVTSPWPAAGIIKSIVTDNGKEYVAAGTRWAFSLLGIDTQTNPPAAPANKPYIERVFRTLNELGIHEQSGSTMSNPKMRGERRPDSENLQTIEEVERDVAKLICDVYHRRKHRMLGCSPLAEWERLTNQDPIDPVRDPEILRKLTEDETTRVVSHEGIELNGIRYNSAALAEVHRMLGSRQKVAVFYDASDLTEIRVRVPGMRSLLSVRCVDPDDAGLDLKTQKMIRKNFRSKSRPEDEIAYRKNRAAMVRHNRAVNGKRPAHMRPHGYRPDVPEPVVSDVPAKRRKRLPKSTLVVRSGDADILDLTPRATPPMPACVPAAPQAARFSPKAIPQDVINE
jgi:transposase InsO family protein